MRQSTFKLTLFIGIFLSTIGIAKDLEALTAVVTGASRGIGLSLAKELLEDNIKVIAIVRDKQNLDHLSQKYPQSLQVIEADLSTPKGIATIIDNILEDQIDYLVHNAAIIEPLGTNALLEASETDLRKILETNLVAPIILTALLNSKLTHGSRVLNVSSRAGDQAFPGIGMYCITKVGLDRYTESLALDQPHGILAASVHPGEVDTGMQGDLRTYEADDFPFGIFFHKNLKEGKLISPALSAKYLKWLLSKTSDDEFVREKHNIYDHSHHSAWLNETLPNPY